MKTESLIIELQKLYNVMPRAFSEMPSVANGDKAIEAFNAIGIYPKPSGTPIETWCLTIESPKHCLSEVTYSTSPEKLLGDIYNEFKLMVERRIGNQVIMRLENNLGASVVAKDRSELYGDWKHCDDARSFWWIVSLNITWFTPKVE